MIVHVNKMQIIIEGDDLTPEQKIELEKVVKDELDRHFELLNAYERQKEALAKSESVAATMRLLGCSEQFITETFNQ